MKAGVMAKASSIISRVKISDKIITGSYSLIILLGGACGTGKSTLASTLSSLMKISDVVSTDTLRHILRSHLPKEGHEPLFGSTYDVVK